MKKLQDNKKGNVDTNIGVSEHKEGTVVTGERVILGVYGIKCDNCDYADMSVPYAKYTSYIDKPCPKCDFPLLTESQMEEVNSIVQASNIINSLSDEDMVVVSELMDSIPQENNDALISSLPDWMQSYFQDKPDD